jgi:imidazoleglycerol-phosphate dehydratase
MARISNITRKTRETDITVKLNLDGKGQAVINTGIGFFDHLLASLTKHAAFDLELNAQGDLHVDGHHTVEDVGIVLGQAIAAAAGDGRGIQRFGFAYCPLDESLGRAVVDYSGRPFLHFSTCVTLQQVGTFAGELFEEFLRALTMNAKFTLHVELLHGRNQHHAMEAMIKAVARSLKACFAIDEREGDIPSTKGVLV